VSHLLMNKKSFDSLPKSYQTMVRMAAGNQILYNYAESEAANPDAMAEMATKYGVQVKRWTDDQIAVFEKVWLEVVKEESSKDPLFKRISDDYLAFRAKYKVWGDSQTLKPTYQK
jgi:TRAP-type mannitol/chloroaromatic compound transport system substrate-binding protein